MKAKLAFNGLKWTVNKDNGLTGFMSLFSFDTSWKYKKRGFLVVFRGYRRRPVVINGWCTKNIQSWQFTFPQHIQHINVVFEFPILNMEIPAEKQILKDNGTLLFEIFFQSLLGLCGFCGTFSITQMVFRWIWSFLIYSRIITLFFL